MASQQVQSTTKSVDNVERQEMRIVLVGKTGVGKSKLGNSLLKHGAFVSKNRSTSQTSQCAFGERVLNTDEKLVVIDTPGLFDTKKNNFKTFKEISRCIILAAPGPHMFIFVLSLSRFTKEELATVNILQDGFGKDVNKYMMVVFTGRDSLIREGDTIEDWLKDASKDLTDVLTACGNNYAAIDNIDNAVEDADSILQMIKERKLHNKYYTNAMFKSAGKLEDKYNEQCRQKTRDAEKIREKLGDEKQHLQQQKDMSHASNELMNKIARLEADLKEKETPAPSFREHVQNTDGWFKWFVKGVANVTLRPFGVDVDALLENI